MYRLSLCSQLASWCCNVRQLSAFRSVVCILKMQYASLIDFLHAGRAAAVQDEPVLRAGGGLSVSRAPGGEEQRGMSGVTQRWRSRANRVT